MRLVKERDGRLHLLRCVSPAADCLSAAQQMKHARCSRVACGDGGGAATSAAAAAAGLDCGGDRDGS